MILNSDMIKKIIASVPKRKKALPGYRESAILMLFFVRGKETYLVTIRRTKGMTLHSGQMAFPGGKIDPQDKSSYEAAIRETYEEIGVARNQYIHLGDMGFFETLTSNYDAAAHLAWCPEQPAYKINHFEVDEIIEIPVSELRKQFRPDLDFNNGEEVLYLNFHFTPKNSQIAHLWGLTARITHHFLQGLSDKENLVSKR